MRELCGGEKTQNNPAVNTILRFRACLLFFRYPHLTNSPIFLSRPDHTQKVTLKQVGIAAASAYTKITYDQRYHLACLP